MYLLSARIDKIHTKSWIENREVYFIQPCNIILSSRNSRRSRAENLARVEPYRVMAIVCMRRTSQGSWKHFKFGVGLSPSLAGRRLIKSYPRVSHLDDEIELKRHLENNL